MHCSHWFIVGLSACGVVRVTAKRRGPSARPEFGLASASVSGSERLIRVVGAAMAVVIVGVVVLLLAGGTAGNGDSATSQNPSDEIVATPDEPTALATATATPVPTPTPTPTPVPTPIQLAEAAPLGALVDTLSTPLPDCGLLTNPDTVAGTVTLTCIEDWASVPVVAAAGGRIVAVVNAPVPALANSEDEGSPGEWSWADQARLGRHVVIDHGAVAGTTNSQTVYAGLETIADTISLGAVVAAGEPLGSVSGPEASLQFSIWSNNTRQDDARVLAEAPSAEEQRAVAAALSGVITSPTDERCPLVLGFGQLPGAPRQYRNGTHQGIDFGCGAADRSGYAIADGTVVYLVNDYDDPSVPEREALLQLAAIAGFTPHWTLVMLYGNVVVVDHGEIPGAGRVVTITAHLEEVDPAVSLGSTVTQGQRLGELGNRGTNASALGVRGDADPSLHLHWELFIDNWFLGSGLDPGTIAELISTTLCGAAETAGCAA